MIDNNEIFIEGDRDLFLKHFVEPYLKSYNSEAMPEVRSNKTYPNDAIRQNHPEQNEQIKIFHHFSKPAQKATALFDLSTKKVTYREESNLSPSKAAIKANEEFTGKRTSLNGWIFWRFLDETGIEKTINNLK